MITYWQKDPQWKDLTIGDTKLTLEKYGCYICAIAFMKGQSPDVVLEILNRNHCFTISGKLDNYQAAKALGMTYNYMTVNPDHACVVETNQFKGNGYPQHFFVWLNDGEGNIMDPLDGEIKKCQYNMVSYRIWEPTPPEFRSVIDNYTPEQMEKKKTYCYSIGITCSTCNNNWCKNHKTKRG